MASTTERQRKKGFRVKVVGNRRAPAAMPLSDEWDGFVGLAEALRRGKPFVPRGVYRFRTFEDAEEWEIRMMLGEAPPAAGSRPRKS